MRQAFDELETLAQQPIDLSLPLDLTARMQEYHDASLEEIFALLEEATEVYATVASRLPWQLQRSARKEVEFYIWLFQLRLIELIQLIRLPAAEIVNCYLAAS